MSEIALPYDSTIKSFTKEKGFGFLLSPTHDLFFHVNGLRVPIRRSRGGVSWAPSLLMDESSSEVPLRPGLPIRVLRLEDDTKWKKPFASEWTLPTVYEVDPAWSVIGRIRELLPEKREEVPGEADNSRKMFRHTTIIRKELHIWDKVLFVGNKESAETFLANQREAEPDIQFRLEMVEA